MYGGGWKGGVGGGLRVSDLEGSDGLRPKKKENGKERASETEREEMAEQKGDGEKKKE